MSKTISEKIKTTLRITLGVCFILSGVMKAVNVYAFAQEIRLYIEAYMDSYFVQWMVEIAVTLCAIETITGLLALRKRCEAVVSVVFLCMMSFFVWLTGMNYLIPSLMGSVESCGCFGELIHFSPLASFVKSIVLWTMAIGLFGLCLSTKWKLSIKCIITDRKTYITIILGCLPAVFSYICFEKMEHSWYLAGYIALCIVVTYFIRILLCLWEKELLII